MEHSIASFSIDDKYCAEGRLGRECAGLAEMDARLRGHDKWGRECVGEVIPTGVRANQGGRIRAQAITYLVPLIVRSIHRERLAQVARKVRVNAARNAHMVSHELSRERC